MSLEFLKKNILQEKNLIKRLEFLSRTQIRVQSQGSYKTNVEQTINALKEQIKILNNTLPSLIKNITLSKELPSENKKIIKKNKGDLVNISHTIDGSEINVGIKPGDKKNYLKQLHIFETSLKKLKTKRKKKEIFSNEYKRANWYVKLSNKVFSRMSSDFVDKGDFNNLSRNLRKGNFTILTHSYVSMMFFTTLLSIFAGIFIFAFFLFVGLSLESPFIYFVNFNKTSLLIRILKTIWIIPATPVLTFLSMYFYPAAEANSLKQNIDYELPFVTIQMSAIAGANIEPSNIFKIISLSREYPYIRNESKKLMNQINLYGYDLTTALRNIAQISPSKNWRDLINGMATTLRSGGNLSKYLNKKAESLLFEYRLKREKATKAAETFMDIYISVVIAAPMLMMLLLIVINLSGIGFNMSLSVLTILIVSIVALINVIFIVFLHLSQKKI